ncbi:conserved hypothetical protein [delta proteobacterium NaphS2]|nr:conserved hypothetical protein [delta proteobacterium NaphS2]
MPMKRFTAMISLFLLSFVAASGCSATKDLTKKVLPTSVAKKFITNEADLKKRIMTFPFIDKADVGPELTKKLSNEFYDHLRSSPNLLLYNPPDGVFSIQAMESPQYGVVTSNKLVDIAEDMGMNALIIGVLNPVEIAVHKTGIWPFDDWKKFYTVSVAVNVIHTASKTLVYTDVALKEYHKSLEESDQLDQEAYIKEITLEALPDLISDLGTTLDFVVSDTPWTGRILAVDGDSIMINAGKEVGLQDNAVFKVFSLGESITSGTGRTIHLLGETIGEIKVTSAMEKHSLAEPLTGGPFKTKQFIRLAE